MNYLKGLGRGIIDVAELLALAREQGEYLVDQGQPLTPEIPGCGCIWEYECTRCRGCYRHDHTTKWNEKLERWQWECKDGNIRRVVFEKRPEDKGRRREPKIPANLRNLKLHT